MPKNSCIMQIWAESGKSALPICNYSQILYQFLTFTQNLKRSRQNRHLPELAFLILGTYFTAPSSHHHKADPIGFLQAFSQYVPALLYSRRHPQSTDYPYLRHLTSACNRHISSYNPHNHLTFPPHHQNFHTFS